LSTKLETEFFEPLLERKIHLGFNKTNSAINILKIVNFFFYLFRIKASISLSPSLRKKFRERRIKYCSRKNTNEKAEIHTDLCQNLTDLQNEKIICCYKPKNVIFSDWEIVKDSIFSSMTHRHKVWNTTENSFKYMDDYMESENLQTDDSKPCINQLRDLRKRAEMLAFFTFGRETNIVLFKLVLYQLSRIYGLENRITHFNKQKNKKILGNSSNKQPGFAIQ